MNEESKTAETEDTAEAPKAEVTEAAGSADQASEEESVDTSSDEAGDSPGAEAAADDSTAPAEFDAEAATEAPADEPDAPAEPDAEAAAEAPADEPDAPAEPDAEAPADEPDAQADTEAAASEAVAEAPSEAESKPAPEYDFEMLHNMTVHQLQEVAATVDHDAVHGFSTMHKEILVAALCLAFGIEGHAHHEVVGIDKFATKAKINALKIERDEAFAAGDMKRVKQARRRIHNLKHRLRKATV